MKKRIAILGSTGSVGTQTVKIIKEYQDDFELCGISARSNFNLLSQQANEFKPVIVAISKKEFAEKLELNYNCKKIYGDSHIKEFISSCDCDIFVNAISGINGLEASYQVLSLGKDLALANKESIVSAGPLLMELAKKTGSKILPLDSEHSAIWQCLQGEKYNSVSKIILTASGGPFFNFSKNQLSKITPAQALKHPTWNMGNKISIDSATLMNKGLEVIEASVLFNMPLNKIDVLVHPQSIIHSLVEYDDGALIAQLGITDMGQPIQYALFNKSRVKTTRPCLSLADIQKLTFFEPDLELFKCLGLAYQALKMGEAMPAVLNAANQVAVNKFLAKEITFLQIPELISIVMSKQYNTKINSVEDVLYVQSMAIKTALSITL
ncbi:1-deoxy-D-xylulose-5-phosphate reductoisomerase [Clostridium sp. 'deep sea']|uniref:1-deoxy-D-xylulose-5-phosphate reductoisomerase n=1 Tax=Clostridium sp. 'deep sea' TaxID=2779445 RepID=UPI0018967491|nr:1-deoxy-D-xylulose-5-phosphate reductoisomerase [Clostridium sp. 'deep sea']QOR36026.1 1-deoxy-D-xylulose-5-phosphate reductoisomerase [Clostridium sp. 'deep sea']